MNMFAFDIKFALISEWTSDYAENKYAMSEGWQQENIPVFILEI